MKKKSKQGKPSGDGEFPGYPKYPEQEDIMNRAKRVAIDVDGTPVTDSPDPSTSKPTRPVKGVKHSDSDVTKEDLKVLRDENSFEGDDQVLEDRVYPVDFAGEDLDVPGTELDDKSEIDGNEDEENNIYSLGGENHEDLEEDRS
ncbi:MAG TPA: hypothetical protein VK666_05210 [Chryseolinea sp.]|nr:hypothetical protein [Chryseolinea sp.]